MEWEAYLNAFVGTWRSVRRDTQEMLAGLDDHLLHFHPPGQTWKPLYWQFGCIGRTQHVYTQALLAGRMDFAFFASATLPAHDTYRHHDDLRRFLAAEDAQWLAALAACAADARFVVQWPMGPVPLLQHIALLQEHERLHHGQFIAYFTLAGVALPAGFRSDWGL